MRIFDKWTPTFPKLVGAELVLDLPLVGHQRAVGNRVEAGKGHGKHAARSALFHLGRAWAIRDLDPEMAVFRCITAEEEAATAIILSLQRLKYPGADRLNRRDHKHKVAVALFVESMWSTLREYHQLPAGLTISLQIPVDAHSTPIRLRIRLPESMTGATPVWLEPPAPLDLQLQEDGALSDLGQIVESAVRKISPKSLGKHIEDLANMRNILLYAHSNGVPRIDPSNVDQAIFKSRNDVLAQLLVFALVDGHTKHQFLILQCLAPLLEVTSRARPRKDGARNAG